MPLMLNPVIETIMDLVSRIMPSNFIVMKEIFWYGKKQNRFANLDPMMIMNEFLVENIDVFSRSGYDDGQFYEGMPR